MLSVHGITKYFGELAANDGVDFDIRPGEIHALLGENGAGKSTLVKMLYGSLAPTSGEIRWDGRPVTIESPARARDLGIGMVFQHFSLFEALTVAENIALSMPGHMSVGEVAERASDYSMSYGLPLNPDALVGDLSVGERQRVEIVRCLMQEPQLLVLDEPTSVLTPQEAESLFKTIGVLKDEGRSILFISHRLEEVRTHCDRATILRYGKVIGSCDPKEKSASELASMMVGADVRDIEKHHEDTESENVLDINYLSLPALSPFAVSLKRIGFQVREGEIFGIAGIAGNGQSELFEALCGERTVKNPETVKIRDQNCGKLGINRRRRLGAGFVPEERNGHGAVGDLRLSENLLLARHNSDKVAFLRGGPLAFIMRGMTERAAKRICEEMDVRKSGEDPFASSLSGGNLQKFMVGRELDRQPKLLIVNQPTWGVDAGAAQRIRQGLIDLAESGSAVLVISQDLDEIFELSDRIAVLFEGQLSDPLLASATTRDELGLLMSGVGFEKWDGQNVA